MGVLPVTLDADVSVRLGGFELSATVHASAGETVAVVGPNGAGKTTLLRALAGLVPLSGGQVTIDAGTVGVVFQEPRLFPRRSVVDNVAFGLRCRGVSRGAAREQARPWVARLGLDGMAETRAGELSMGQARRAAIARALAVEPAVLLLDEPFAALDAAARVDVRGAVRDGLASFLGARVLVTHDAVEALALAQRVIVLEGGRVVQEGSTSDVVARPRSRYAADLVGVNLLRGRATPNEVALASGRRLVVPHDETGDVLAVIHPRAVALFGAEPGGSPRNVWPATVASVDVEGDRVRVALAGVVPLVAEVTPAAVRDLSLAPGERVWAAVKATEIDVYPE